MNRQNSFNCYLAVRLLTTVRFYNSVSPSPFFHLIIHVIISVNLEQEYAQRIKKVGVRLIILNLDMVTSVKNWGGYLGKKVLQL